MARRTPTPTPPRFRLGLRVLADGLCRLGPDPAPPKPAPEPGKTALDLWRKYPAESRFTSGRFRLRAARRAMGLTQMELAERVGLRQQVTISLLESGRGESSPAVWRRLESVLGVPMAELRTVGDAR